MISQAPIYEGVILVELGLNRHQDSKDSARSAFPQAFVVVVERLVYQLSQPMFVPGGVM